MNEVLIGNIANITMYLFFILLILIVLVAFLSSYISDKKSEKRYKISIINLLISDDVENMDIEEIIKNLYTDYRTKSNTPYLSLVDINSRLISELRDNTYKKYYSTNKEVPLQKINWFENKNKIFRENLLFSDKKAQEILKIVKSSNLPNEEKSSLHEKILIFYTSLYSYCNGQIFEKEQVIFRKDLEITNLKKKKLIIRIVGSILSFIGLMSSLKTLLG